MRVRETTVFSCGKQVEHTRLNYREVSMHSNGEDIETTDLIIEDVLNGVFYPLDSYLDQLSHVGVKNEQANIDTYYVLDSLLSQAKQKMEKIIDAFEKHLGGRAYFLEVLSKQSTYTEKMAGDFAGIMVRKLDNDQETIYDLVKAAKAKGHDVDAVMRDLAGRDPKTSKMEGPS